MRVQSVSHGLINDPVVYFTVWERSTIQRSLERALAYVAYEQWTTAVARERNEMGLSGLPEIVSDRKGRGQLTCYKLPT
jgi:hypothetical protein